MKRLLCLILVSCVSLFAYDGPIDVVIPAHEKDIPMLDLCIEGIKKNLVNVGTVYVVSKEGYTNNALWVPESCFPFSIRDVGNELGGDGGIGEHSRRGWYFQQLLKFYAHHVIEGLSEYFLVLDSDTVILRPMAFITEDERTIFNVYSRRCFLSSYYSHMTKLHPSLVEVDKKKNPVVHHMLFKQEYLQELFALVEGYHHKPFWLAFLNEVYLGKNENLRLFNVGASEYTIYYNFMRIYHPDQCAARFPKAYNKVRGPSGFNEMRARGFDIASSHDYYRTND